MTPKEIVKRTLEFNSPERVPRHLWYLPWAKVNHPEKLKKIQTLYPDDIVSSPGFYTKLSEEVQHFYDDDGPAHLPGLFTDEWGCTFLNKQKGLIGEVKEPLIKDWSDFEKAIIPYDYLNIDIDKVNDFCKSSDKFILPGVTGGSIPRPFERLQFIRGTENLYVDLIERPAEFNELLHKMHEFNIKILETWAKTNVDALSFMDDWGSQRSLLISPKLWREIFKPMYKDYADIAHKNNKFFFMHSDGYIMDIYPDLIEIGVDAVNSQLFCMDIKEIGLKYSGKISFWGEIDRQQLLPNGTPEEIINAVKLLKESLYKNGGVFAQCEFGAGANPDNVELVFKTWNEIV
jgi:uroporphyrinogen decarboxylase